MSTAALLASSQGRRFMFDGVIVDEAAGRLFVDGRERLCSQRALRLLVVMCESAGQVLPKQRVIDRLWPGGQIVSDEALTQAVFRARACLDGHADRLVTVRGVGLRLDAEVRRDDASLTIESSVGELRQAAALAPTPLAASLPEPASFALPPADAVPLDHAHPAPASARPTRWLYLLLILIAIATAFWLGRRGDSPAEPGATLDRGYGLTLADAHVAREDTPALLREAFEYEGRGDRARARALLETAHSSDASTPLPALFLALWSIGNGDAVAADQWLQEARQRLRTIVSPILTALLRYIEAEHRGTRDDVLRYAGAVLDLRPEAWQLRLARAHMLQSDGMRDAALREISAISIDTLSHRKLAMALADRASLGDPDGAEAEFARLAHTSDEQSTLAYTRARLAWTRQDLVAAAKAYADAVEAARREARFDIEHRATINLGVIAMLRGEREQAASYLERARGGMTGTRWTLDEVDIGLMLAQLHALAGDATGTATELALAESAAANGRAGGLRDLCQVYRARLLPDTPRNAVEPGSDSTLAPLLDAYAALHAGQTDAARAAFRIAQRRATPNTALFEEVRLLAARLGEAVPAPERIDPPYPPQARFATRLALAALAPSSEDIAP